MNHLPITSPCYPVTLSSRDTAGEFLGRARDGAESDRSRYRGSRPPHLMPLRTISPAVSPRHLITCMSLTAGVLLWLLLTPHLLWAHGAISHIDNSVPACMLQQPVSVTQGDAPETKTRPESLFPVLPVVSGWSKGSVPSVITQPVPLRNVACVNGMAGTYPCKNVDLLAYLPPSQLGNSQSGNDIWGWEDSETQQAYALVGQYDALAIVEITNPNQPRLVGRIPTHSMGSNWRGVKVYRDHAYIVADNAGAHGLQIFDLRGLRTLSTTVESSTAITLSATAHITGFRNAHNIAINEESGFAYLTGSDQCKGGLYMLNLSNPISPTFAGCYEGDGYVHDTQCVIYRGTDLAYRNHEICFNSSLYYFSIVDVSDKISPTMISHITLPTSIYIHQGWLTGDQAYVLIDDELDETFYRFNGRTYLLDVRNLAEPRLLDIHDSGHSAIDHNLFIRQAYAFETNFTARVRVMDAQDAASGRLSELAYLDTYPENDNPVLSGSWGSYPFFKSGVVAVNTIDRGLFILRPTLPKEVVFDSSQKTSFQCRQNTPQVGRIEQIQVNVISRNGYSGSLSLVFRDLPTVVTATVEPNHIEFTEFTGLLESASPASQAEQVVTITLHYQDINPQDDTQTYSARLVMLDASQATQPVLDQMTIQFFKPHTTMAAPLSALPMADRQAIHPAFPYTLTVPVQGHVLDYAIEIAETPAFTETIYEETSPKSMLPLHSLHLTANRTYYWRARGRNECGEGDLSQSLPLIIDAYRLYLPIGSRATR